MVTTLQFSNLLPSAELERIVMCAYDLDYNRRWKPKMNPHTERVDNEALIEADAHPARYEPAGTIMAEGETFDLRGARGFAITIGLSIAAWAFIVFVFLQR